MDLVVFHRQFPKQAVAHNIHKHKYLYQIFLSASSFVKALLIGEYWKCVIPKMEIVMLCMLLLTHCLSLSHLGNFSVVLIEKACRKQNNAS